MKAKWIRKTIVKNNDTSTNAIAIIQFMMPDDTPPLSIPQHLLCGAA
jgi:hypothetical protein